MDAKAEVKPNPNDDFGPPDDESVDIALEPIAEKPAVKAKPTPPPTISPALRRAAKSLGISDDEIDSTNPSNLEEAVSFLIEDRERLRAAQQKPAKEPEEEDDDAALDAMDKELSLDPRLKKLLKKQVGSAKEIKELKAALAEQTKREQARAARAGNDAIDAGFDALGDDYKGVFGEGGHTTIKKDSKEFKRRVAIYHAAQVDFANDSPATITRKIVKAAKEAFEDFVVKKTPVAKPDDDDDDTDTESAYKAPVKKPKPRKEGPDLDLGGNTEVDWEEAGTARPTNRKIPEKKGTKAAANAVRQFYQEKGFPGAGDEDVFNGVPE